MKKIGILYSTPLWVKNDDDNNSKREQYANELVNKLSVLTKFNAMFKVVVGYASENMSDVMKSFDGVIFVFDNNYIMKDRSEEVYDGADFYPDCGEGKELKNCIYSTKTPRAFLYMTEEDRRYMSSLRIAEDEGLHYTLECLSGVKILCIDDGSNRFTAGIADGTNSGTIETVNFGKNIPVPVVREKKTAGPCCVLS